MMKIRHRGRIKTIFLIFIATGVLIRIGSQIRQIIRGIEGDSQNSSSTTQIVTQETPHLPPDAPPATPR